MRRSMQLERWMRGMLVAVTCLVSARAVDAAVTTNQIAVPRPVMG